jgi:gamma-glutamylcyclotransferase (GGCT)/AIG2-like uncharacterized protein YtfP
MLPLATYGTLLRPFGMHERLGVDDALAFIAPCVLPGTLYDLGRYPGARPLADGETGTVQGELYRLRDTATLDLLDRYEDYSPDREDDSIFLRRRVTLVEPAGQEAWIYWYNGTPPGPQVPSGDWVAHVAGDDRDWGPEHTVPD